MIEGPGTGWLTLLQKELSKKRINDSFATRRFPRKCSHSARRSAAASFASPVAPAITTV